MENLIKQIAEFQEIVEDLRKSKFLRFFDSSILPSEDKEAARERILEEGLPTSILFNPDFLTDEIKEILPLDCFGVQLLCLIPLSGTDKNCIFSWAKPLSKMPKPIIPPPPPPVKLTENHQIWDRYTVVSTPKDEQ